MNRQCPIPADQTIYGVTHETIGQIVRWVSADKLWVEFPRNHCQWRFAANELFVVAMPPPLPPPTPSADSRSAIDAIIDAFNGDDAAPAPLADATGPALLRLQGMWRDDLGHEFVVDGCHVHLVGSNEPCELMTLYGILCLHGCIALHDAHEQTLKWIAPNGSCVTWTRPPASACPSPVTQLDEGNVDMAVTKVDVDTLLSWDDYS